MWWKKPEYSKNTPSLDWGPISCQITILEILHGPYLSVSRLVFYVKNKDNPTDPKFLDRQVWANSVDPDQTVPEGDQGLHCLPFRLHALLYSVPHDSSFRVITFFFRASQFFKYF